MGHPGDIVPFLEKVALRLEHGAADQGVEAALDLRDAALEVEGGALDAELLDQEFPKIRLDLVVPGFSGEMAEDVERAEVGRQGWSFLVAPGL